jgi:hypothetical protein
LHPSDDVRRTHGARLPRYLPTVSEQRYRRDALNPKLGGNALFGVCIEFTEPDPGLQLGRRLLECRRHHLARSAPGRPKVHKHWNVVAIDMFLKITGSEFYRARGKQRIVTLAAFRPFRHSCRGNSVDGIAGWTNDVLRFTHDCVFSNGQTD